jgi:hypothetical protein
VINAYKREGDGGGCHIVCVDFSGRIKVKEKSKSAFK